MLRPTKWQAKERIGRSLEQIPALSNLNDNAEEFIKWERNTRIAIANAFGEDSRNAAEFRSISFVASVGTGDPGYYARVNAEAYERSLANVKAILESMLEEIQEYWPDDAPAQAIAEAQVMSEQQVSNRVFVVHGRDDGSKETVARYLSSLGLVPVILHEQPNEGRTIVEKFEDYADVGFAVVLCTPDDVGTLASDPGNLRPRPRQNVVLELGFFLGKMGRNKVCALLDGDMDMPSDYGGVLYIRLDGGEGWKLTLAREMRAAGMNIDMNLLA